MSNRVIKTRVETEDDVLFRISYFLYNAVTDLGLPVEEVVEKVIPLVKERIEEEDARKKRNAETQYNMKKTEEILASLKII